MDEISKFIKGMKGAAKKQVPVQTVWATVKEVQWTGTPKTMTVVGVTDGLEYFDVLLGLGSEYKKPKLNSKCLIGIIENKDAQAFLIHADEIEEHLINGDHYGGLLISAAVANEVNELKEDLNALKQVFLATWVVTPQDGGAALKVAAATWAGDQLIQVQDTDLENDTIKHGNG